MFGKSWRRRAEKQNWHFQLGWSLVFELFPVNREVGKEGEINEQTCWERNSFGNSEINPLCFLAYLACLKSTSLCNPFSLTISECDFEVPFTWLPNGFSANCSILISPGLTEVSLNVFCICGSSAIFNMSGRWLSSPKIEYNLCNMV